MFRNIRTSLTTRLLLCVLASIFLLSATAFAQNGLPALIDREILLGNPEIARATISPDGKFVAFLKRPTGRLFVFRVSNRQVLGNSGVSS